MPINSIKTVIDQIPDQTTYFIFAQKDSFDKKQVFNFAKKTYLESSGKYQLNRLQKVLKICQKKYKKSSICFLTIEKQNDKKKIILCGKGELNCVIKKNNKDYPLPIIQKGISGFLGQNDKVYIKTDEESAQIKTAKVQKQKIPSKDLPADRHGGQTPKVDRGVSKNPKVQLDLKSKINDFKNKLKKTKKLKPRKITPKKISKPKAANLSFSYKKKPLFSKKRIISLILASVFLVLLGFFIGFGVHKKRQFEKDQLEQRLKSDIEYRLKQAETLKDINPQRAKTLLSEAKYILTSYQKSNLLPEFLISLSGKVDDSYAQIAQIYHVSPEIFYDLSLVSDKASPNQISLSDKSLSLLDNKNQIILILDIDKKAGEILAGKDLVDKNSQLASIDNRIFLASDGKIQIINKKAGNQLNSFKLNKVTVNGLTGYGSNLYVLDKNLGQLWRFRGSGNTLGKAEEFFNKEQDFTDITSLSLDGSLWLLDSAGGIYKYTQGIKDAYFPEFGLDNSLNNPQKIFTDEYCNNLYVLDQANSRIVIISKKGVYQGQYVDEQIKDISDFVVSEQIGKILLSKNDKIYSIDLKQ